MRRFSLVWMMIPLFSLIALKESNSYQPPTGRTGAPGEGTCAGCHGGGSPAPTITLTHNGQPLSTYIPGGSPIQISLSVSHPTLSKYGFQLTVLSSQSGQEETPNQGLAVGSGVGITLQSRGARQYVAHQGVSSTGVWTFEWRPPLTNIGPLTWYIAANAVNGNGSPNGDAPATATVTVQPDQNASLDIQLSAERIHLPSETIEASFYTLEGREVARFIQGGSYEWRFPPGPYLFRWRNAHTQVVRKVWIGP
ncbi:MAG: choice-of-anchor V domain-containing protein [Bacteroidia bacterium]|nr:hypothetical protein [Bacteroidia bacterium]MDW8015659.1 choice-of-anchor V domain-containing protein [Bacteroidia bacterium]